MPEVVGGELSRKRGFAGGGAQLAVVEFDLTMLELDSASVIVDFPS